MQTFGVFRNDGDDGDLFRNDGDDGDDGDGSRAYAGARPNSQMAQALWRTRGDLTKGFEGGIGTPVWTDQPLDKPVFGRWSRDVRAHLYSFELLSGLYFDSSSDTVGHLYSTQITPKQGESPPKFETVLESVHKLERPPFDTNKELFENELRNIMSKTGYRAERMAEILTQVTVPYSFFAMVLNLQPGRHRHTFELMSTVFRLSSTVVMQFKHHLRVRRPADRSPLVQPVLAVPGHASYPAGHATQCFFVATVLESLVGLKLGADLKDQLYDLAYRIADNRVIAGLHYVKDNEAGKELGIALANYFKQRAKVSPALGWLWGEALKEWENV